MTDDIQAVLAKLDGARIPGGCDDCDAFQDVVANAYGLRGVTMLNTCHDDDCPTLARYEGRVAPAPMPPRPWDDVPPPDDHDAPDEEASS